MLSIIVSMYLYQAAASASAPAPDLVSLEIEVVADSSLDALPRHLAPLTRCPPQPDEQVGAARRFYGNHFETPPVPFDCYLVSLTLAGETRVEMAFPTGGLVQFDFRKIRLHGIVTRGAEGVAATLDFEPNIQLSVPGLKATSASAKSDGSGEYEARLWRNQLYAIHVRPDEGGASVSKFQLATSDAEEQTKDFALSANTLVVTVLDAKTGDPIPGAKLLYIDSDGSQLAKTDSMGTLTIESIPAGPFHATAVAPDYVNAASDWVIEDRDDPQPFEIEMKAKSEGNDFQVMMPDGSPAGNVWAYYRYDPQTHSRIRIPCDAEGTCHPGERPADGEAVVLSHDGAGLTVAPAGTIYETGSVTLWPSGGPLVLNLKPGPESSAGCEGPVIAVRGWIVATDGSFTCGETPWPLEFANLPVGPIEVTILSKGVDDHGRFTPGARLAGPVPVTLPSDPIEIAIP